MITDDEIVDLANRMLRPEDNILDVDSRSIVEFARELLRQHDAGKLQRRQTLINEVYGKMGYVDPRIDTPSPDAPEPRRTFGCHHAVFTRCGLCRELNRADDERWGTSR